MGFIEREAARVEAALSREEGDAEGCAHASAATASTAASRTGGRFQWGHVSAGSRGGNSTCFASRAQHRPADAPLAVHRLHGDGHRELLRARHGTGAAGGVSDLLAATAPRSAPVLRAVPVRAAVQHEVAQPATQRLKEIRHRGGWPGGSTNARPPGPRAPTSWPWCPSPPGSRPPRPGRTRPDRSVATRSGAAAGCRSRAPSRVPRGSCRPR